MALKDTSIQYPLEILIAEDNKINQLVIKDLLNSLGYKVDLIDNGKKAVDCCNNKNYDIVLMDIRMPVMDGIKATFHIRQNLPADKCPIIVAVTADAFNKTKEYLLEKGLDYFVAKPITLESIENLLKHCYNVRSPKTFLE